jgi:hypothetical protein
MHVGMRAHDEHMNGLPGRSRRCDGKDPLRSCSLQ